ncbi:MAG: hypothetical protein R3B72_37890 [Polyangiaceae bacterium]
MRIEDLGRSLLVAGLLLTLAGCTVKQASQPSSLAAAPAFRLRPSHTWLGVGPRKHAQLRLPRFLPPGRLVQSPTGTRIQARMLDPNGVVGLPNGNRIDVQTYLDKLDELEQASPGILGQLRRTPKQRRLNPRTMARLAQSHRRLAQSVAGRGAVRFGFSPSLPRLRPPQGPARFNLRGLMKPTQAVKSWVQGDAETFGSSLALRIDNHVDAAGGASCRATVELDATVLGRSVPKVAEARLQARQSGSEVVAGAELLVLGKTLFGQSVSGTVAKSVSIKSPRYAATYPIVGPVGVEVHAQLVGELGVEGRLGAPDNGKPGCAFELRPNGRVQALMGARLAVGSSALAAIFRLLADVGVNANIDLVAVSTPIRSEIWHTGGATFRERLSGSVDASLLKGEVYAYIDLPDILFLFDGGYFTIDLMAWPGETFHDELFPSVERTVTFGALDPPPLDGEEQVEIARSVPWPMPL